MEENQNKRQVSLLPLYLTILVVGVIIVVAFVVLANVLEEPLKYIFSKTSSQSIENPELADNFVEVRERDSGEDKIISAEEFDPMLHIIISDPSKLSRGTIEKICKSSVAKAFSEQELDEFSTEDVSQVQETIYQGCLDSF